MRVLLAALTQTVCFDLDSCQSESDLNVIMDSHGCHTSVSYGHVS